jgi:effector-binding domain-containing protein
MAVSLGVMLAGLAVALFAEQGTGESDVSIRKSNAQTVLYTVYRGPYETIGKPISELYALAAQKNMKICGYPSLVYLNNPYYTSQNDTGQHCLTEIRIPVDEDAMQQAGTLGAMTDVKEMPSIEVAVMKKQIGQTDYKAIFRNLYEQIAKQGYRPADDVAEVFSGNAKSGDYTQMKSELIVPVRKIEQTKK